MILGPKLEWFWPLDDARRQRDRGRSRFRLGFNNPGGECRKHCRDDGADGFHCSPDANAGRQIHRGLIVVARLAVEFRHQVLEHPRLIDLRRAFAARVAGANFKNHFSHIHLLKSFLISPLNNQNESVNKPTRCNR